MGIVAWLNIDTGELGVFAMAQDMEAREVGISARVCGEWKGKIKRGLDPRMVVDWAKTGMLSD